MEWTGKAVVCFLAILTVLAAGTGITRGETQTADAVVGTAFHKKALGKAPHVVSVRILNKQTAFIAGEEGYFDVQLYREDTDAGPAASYQWDPGAPPVLWISAPPDSGIHFKAREPMAGRSDFQTMIKFDHRSGETDSYSTRVEYHIGKRANAEHSYLWFGFVAPLLAPDGTPVEDVGELESPIKIDTPLVTKLLVLAVIGVAIFLFIVEWVRVDVVAIMIMVALPELGLINPRLTFRGLSSNAVIAIIGVMIISFALNRVGLVNRMLQPILKYVGKSATRMMVIFSSLIALISSVMQNTGAAVLFLPAIRNTASNTVKVPVSRVLMPIGMAAILGGTLTMIGTSPLILLNDLLPAGMKKFAFLELTPIGLALTIGGIGYFATLGKYFLARQSTERAEESRDSEQPRGQLSLVEYSELDGPFELYVPRDYRYKAGPETIVEIRRQFLVNIVAIATNRGVEDTAPAPQTFIRPGTALCVFGPEENIRKFAKDYGLILRKAPVLLKEHFNPGVAGTEEIVISPRSTLLGRTIKQIGFRETFGVNVLALYQRGKTYYRELADRPLHAGDAVLLHGTWEQFQALKDLHENFIFTSPKEIDIKKPHKARQALLCFAATLVLMMISSFYFQNRSYNPIPLSICLMAGALGMILTGTVSINEAYRAVDWRTVFLLGGLLPLGMAVDQTGTAEWVAGEMISATGGHMGPFTLLLLLACMSGAFTLVVSNVGAATLLVPLGISLATQIGINPRAAVIVVALGVSNSFILPTHQVNALYMGPGGYKTLDYIRVGGILSFIYVMILVFVTYFFYL